MSIALLEKLSDMKRRIEALERRIERMETESKPLDPAEFARKNNMDKPRNAIKR
jgi:hypothetical protein